MSLRKLECLLVCAALLLRVGLLPVRADEKKEHAAIKPVSRGGNWEKRHETFIALAKKGNIDLLFLGDSLTDEWGRRAADNPDKRGGMAIWEKEFAPLKAANFGIGGDRTQHVLWRLQNGELDGIKPKVAMLMIGTNNSFDNTAEEIADGIKAIVAEIHKKSPGTKVLLLGIFPRGKDPNAPNIKAQREKLKAANAIVAKLDDGGKTVKYLDIGAKFLQADGTISPEIMPDYLHLTEKGYQIWAEAVKGPIMELLNAK